MTFKVGVILFRHHVVIFPNTHSNLLEIYVRLHYIHCFGLHLIYSNLLEQILKCRFKFKDRDGHLKCGFKFKDRAGHTHTLH